MAETRGDGQKVAAARRTTMRDVARASSVSVMTVSRVVNHSPNVDPATRDRVIEAIQVLGFRPNEAASSLRRNGAATATVGLIVDDVGNPFCSALHRGVASVVRRRGHALVSGFSDREPLEEHRLVSGLLRRADGLVIMGAGPDEGLTNEINRGVTVVFADRRPPGVDADLVSSDDRHAARIATEHLVRHGHRRIGLLTSLTSFSTTVDRCHGYLSALSAEGLVADEALVVTNLAGPWESDAATSRLLALPDPPTAFFVAEGRLTAGTLRALHRQGLTERVALLAFDDFELSDVLRPAVTVVARKPELMGETAAELLFSRWDGYTGPSRSVVVPAELVVRGSGELHT